MRQGYRREGNSGVLPHYRCTPDAAEGADLCRTSGRGLRAEGWPAHGRPSAVLTEPGLSNPYASFTGSRTADTAEYECLCQEDERGRGSGEDGGIITHQPHLSLCTVEGCKPGSMKIRLRATDC